MTRSTLPRSARTRRRLAAAAFVVTVPFTMAVSCQDEAAEVEDTGEDVEENLEDTGEDVEEGTEEMEEEMDEEMDE
jgi:hypothetical protein